MPLRAGARLGPYEILAPLGAGGMGEVYRARDSKLDRDVAIKVLPQSLASDPEALARFEREAKSVAALSHQNILAIHDFGTHEGVTYAVTELLDGQTLREKLESGALPRGQAIDNALQIAKGLAAAHERGVVHRDLKPENVLVARDGHVKILDFGLAKREQKVEPGKETSAPTASGHTQPGSVMGTVGYMSPEQVRGQAVDHRSDIFSLGAILYEMLSGRRAFKKDTAAETMTAILKEEPPDITDSGRSVPPSLDHVVRHCLEKDRDHRFQSARDIQFALGEASGSAESIARPVGSHRGVWLAAAALVVAAAVVGIVLSNRSTNPAIPAVKRIAVLPFENLGAPEDDYFADGMSDEVRGKLTTLPNVQVIARTSSTPYKKTKKSPQEIAKELDVAYLLTGTVRWQKEGGKTSTVVLRPELVEVSGSAAPVLRWQQPFDAALTDVFHVQSEIASRVAQSLGLALGTTEARRLESTPTQNLSAYEAFLKGEAAFRDRDDEYAAFGFYQQAVALDPGFARAWANLSWDSSWLFASERPTAEFADNARVGAEKALALAPDSAGAHLATGVYRWLVLRDFEGGLKQLEVGQGFSPSDTDLLNTRAVIEMNLARWQRAVDHLSQAEHLDPRSADTKIFLGTTLLCLRRLQEAKRVLDQGVEIAPDHLPMLATKGNWFLAHGDLASARALMRSSKQHSSSENVAFLARWFGAWFLDAEQLKTLLKLLPADFNGDRARWSLCLADAYALQNDVSASRRYAEEAKEATEEQLRIAPLDPDSHERLSQVFAFLGRKDDALREAERALTLAPAKNGATGLGALRILVYVRVRLGEHDEAISGLEELLSAPSGLTPAFIKIDPNFDPLRSNPRFQKLVAAR